MKKIIRPLLSVYLLLTLLVSCAEKNKLALPEYTRAVRLQEGLPLSSALLRDYIPHIDLYHFAPSLIRFRNRDKICFLNLQRNAFLLFDLLDSTRIDSLPFAPRNGNGFFANHTGGTFYLFYPSLHLLEVQQLTDDSLAFTQQYVLPAVPRDYVFDEEAGFRILDGATPRVLISYGAFSSRKYNFRDPQGIFILLDPAGTSLMKRGQFPDAFFRTKQYYSGTRFTTDSLHHIYYLHELQDSIYKADADGRVLAAAALEQNQRFDAFDWSKETNLSYVRKYSMETEMNERIEMIQDKWLVICKKLHRDHYTDSQYYKYFVLDTDLRVQYADTIRPACYPTMLTPWRSGFLMLGDSLKKAVYYEVD